MFLETLFSNFTFGPLTLTDCSSFDCKKIFASKMEGKSKTSLMSLGSKEYRSEGKGDQKFEPRITRRMSKVKMSTEGTQGKCVICLGNYEEDRGTLECGHTFCKDCLIRWWRNHSNCPFCRQEILFITTK